jgi:hypothetical protein
LININTGISPDIFHPGNLYPTIADMYIELPELQRENHSVSIISTICNGNLIHRDGLVDLRENGKIGYNNLN